MSTQVKRSRASGEQLGVMIDFFYLNPNVANGKFLKFNGKIENKKKWAELSEKLNAIGGAVKTVEQWQNVWRDLKSRTSVRVRELKKEKAMTGNRPVHQTPLTELEKRVIGLIGVSYMEGSGDTDENIPLEQELQVATTESEQNFQLVVEEEDVNIDLLSTVSENDLTVLRSETPKTPRKTPRRGARRRVEESPTKERFLKIAEEQLQIQRMHAENSRSTAEAITRMAIATEKMAIATEKMGVATEKIGAATEKMADTNATMSEAMVVFGEGVKACAHAFTEFTYSLGPPQ